MEKFDRRRKYYLVLDCETATLPYAASFDSSVKQKIAIAKPLIYDLGWQIIDRQGRVYERKNFLITEIFSVPDVFNTAYYASKRPIYLDMLKRKEIQLVTWNVAAKELIKAMSHCESVGAYNSMFDFKKAIPFTELYISHLYSPDFFEWEEMQKRICDNIASGKTFVNEKNFEGDVFRFRGNTYPLFDLWGLSCEHLINNNDYKKMCANNQWITASGKYFKTSAETTYQFLTKDSEFVESHTALDDATIESEIFAAIVKPTIKNLTIGIIYFPFRKLGTVEEWGY